MERIRTIQNSEIYKFELNKARLNFINGKE
jgi:hypothetical protein